MQRCLVFVLAIIMMITFPIISGIGERTNRGDITGYTSDTVFFQGSGSRDNVAIINFTWNFLYYNTEHTLFGSNQSFSFTSPGIYNITLTVSDAERNLGRDNLTVTVIGKTIPELPELIEIDSDGDGWNDTFENASGSDPLDPLSTPIDWDADGWKNIVEQFAGTDPYNPLSYPGAGMEDDDVPTPDSEKDSDNDTYNDTYELEQGSDPYNPLSTPLDWDGDGIPNEDDAYPRDPKRWNEEGTSIFTILSIVVLISLILLSCLIAYTRIKQKKILDNDIRQNLYAYINHNPGKHFRKIKKHLKVSQGTLTHHIRCLTEADLIVAKQQGNFKFYYPTWMKDQQKPITPVQEELMEIVKQQPGIEIKELAEKLGRESRTIRYHLDNLRDVDRVRSENIEKRTCWFLEEDGKKGLT
ncbi:MAG: ArsR family transcriptional regulator [Candidatus Thermoplasmatota archaeon]|nr:ArsR family transcriptional regulator [Candidatus Thermoplasmatota archaeon]